jgi:hypothetical protein
MPEEVPAPPPEVLAALPDPEVRVAVRLLARLIAATIDPGLTAPADGGQVDVDE